MPAYPSVDECRGRLHRAGWSISETAIGPDFALVWCVTGRLFAGVNLIFGIGFMLQDGAHLGKISWTCCLSPLMLTGKRVRGATADRITF